MRNEKQIKSPQDNIISDDELDIVIGANKELYDKLNEVLQEKRHFLLFTLVKVYPNTLL